jgi:hypothetical protein
MLGYLLFFLAVLAVLAGIAVLPFSIRYKRSAPAIDRVLYLLLPLAAGIAIAILVRHALWTLFPNWAAARLAVTYAWRLGFPIYYPEATGAIVAQNYSPLYFLLYLPASYFSSPTHGVLMGAFMASLYALVPIWWVHYAAGERRDAFWRWAPFVVFGIVGLNLFPITYAIFPIRGDAPMLGFLALAAGLLYKYGRPSSLVLAASAVFAVLAVWTKQPGALGAVALVLYLFIAEGWRMAARYTGWLIAAGVVSSGLFFFLFPPGPLLLNIIKYPLSHPWFTYRCFAFAQVNQPCEYAHSAGERLASFLWMAQNYLSEYAVLFVLLLAVSGATLLLDRNVVKIRQWLAIHRWTAFVFVAALLAPISVANRVKAGGEDSAFGACVYFVLAALTLGIRDMAITPRAESLSKLLMAALLLVYLPVSLGKLNALPTFAEGFYSNPQEVAYEFSKQYPDRAYFPWNPLPVVMSTGILYHFDYAVAERIWSDLPVPAEHYFAHIPARFEMIAYPPTYGDAQQRAALTFFPEFQETSGIPELPRWKIFRRQPASGAERF